MRRIIDVGNATRLKEIDDLVRANHSEVDNRTGQRGVLCKQQRAGRAVGSQNPATALHDAILERYRVVELALDDEDRLALQYCHVHFITMSLDDANRLRLYDFQDCAISVRRMRAEFCVVDEVCPGRAQSRSTHR